MTTDNQNNQNQNHNDHISNVTEIPRDATQGDLLNSEYLTDGLIDYIKHADAPLSISLNGEWGSGKTSIMNTIKNHLCDGDDAKFYGVWINTWQFSLLDSSPAPQAVVRILQSIVNQIIVLNPDYERRKKISQLIGALATISSGLKSVSAAGEPLFGVGKSTFSLAEKALNAFKKLFNTNSNQSQADNAALVKQLSDEIQKLVDEVLTVPNTQKSQEDQVAKYEPYNPCLISKIPNYPCAKFVYFVYFCLCNLSTMFAFMAYYLGLMFFNVIFGYIGRAIVFIIKKFSITKALFDFCCYVVRVGDAICCNEEWPKSTKKDGFVFFIDDLDRIDPNLALEIVEMLASVFSFKKCIFVLAIDKRALMGVVRLKLVKRMINGDDKVNDNDEDNAINDVKSIDKQCKQYLDRFIHISIPVSKIFYNIQPLLRESLLKISFFTPDELNDGLVILLDKVITCSIGKNPRAIKQMINNISLLISLELHTWKYDEDEKKSWQVKGLTKEMLFIIQCIKISHPAVFDALLVRPYFKAWSMNFAANCFYNEKNPATSIKLACRCNATNIWECALFHICKFDENSQLDFYKLRLVFGVIDEIFKNYLLKCNIKQPEQDVYTKIISDVFYYFYRIEGRESAHGISKRYVVKTSKEYRRKR